MVFAPAVRLVPFTESVAVALAPDVVRAAEPSATPPKVKLTLPVGGLTTVTTEMVAVSCVLALGAMEVGLAASAAVVPMAVGRLAHRVTRLYASTDPTPVT